MSRFFDVNVNVTNCCISGEITSIPHDRENQNKPPTTSVRRVVGGLFVNRVATQFHKSFERLFVPLAKVRLRRNEDG